MSLGLGELCLKPPVLRYASNSWKSNYYASEEAVLCSHYAQLCNGILPLTQGLGQATWADYGCMHCHAAINPSTSENLPLCIMQFLDNYNYLKGANEVNREYFQQAVLLCLLRALYYAPMLHVSYYAQNYSGIFRQDLVVM